MIACYFTFNLYEWFTIFYKFKFQNCFRVLFEQVNQNITNSLKTYSNDRNLFDQKEAVSYYHENIENNETIEDLERKAIKLIDILQRWGCEKLIFAMAQLFILSHFF